MSMNLKFRIGILIKYNIDYSSNYKNIQTKHAKHFFHYFVYHLQRMKIKHVEFGDFMIKKGNRK